MKKFTYTIKDEVGLHARPAGLIAKESKKYMSKILIQAKGKEVELTKLMSVMGLGVKKDDEITIVVEGEDEDVAIEMIEKFFRENL